jgi:hypothetical protein
MRILARWRRSVASSEAMNPLHQAVSVVSCRRIILSVETGGTEVHSFIVDDFVIDLTLSN